MPFVLRARPLTTNVSERLLLLCEELLYLLVGNDTLLEHISAGLLRLDHLDALGKLLTVAGLQGCDYFLCHNARLFNFTV